MSEFLEAWYRRDFNNAVLNCPPSVGKSLMVDVFYPAWVWAKEPGHKFLACAFDLDLTVRDADKIIAIVESELYRTAWPGSKLRHDRHARRNIWTEAGGYRFGTSPGGKGFGRHFDSVSFNDPIKPQDVLDGKIDSVGIAEAQRWIDGSLPTRRANPRKFGIMLTMQRLLERDPAGVALERGYAHLCLPMRYEPDAHWIQRKPVDWSGRLDVRRTPGELLHPQRWDSDSVAETERMLAEHASAQLQQNPIPRTGGLLEEQHLRFEWIDLPVMGGYWIQVWDFAAKGTSATHSAVHGALWCATEVSRVNELTNLIRDRERGAPPLRQVRDVAKEVRYLLVDEVWGIHTVPESEALFERVQAQPNWSKAAQRIIEAKAAGIGIIQRFERRFPSVIAFHEIDDVCRAAAQADKLDRHRANLGEWHAGRVLLPPWRATVPDRVDPKDGVGPDAFRKELISFPRGAKDDRVDTSSMALARLTQGMAQHWANVSLLAKRTRR
jgi:phage terminase large subunit-like protein